MFGAPQAAPTDSCATPTATVTKVRQLMHCHYVCPSPGRMCAAGEPTGPTPRPPYVYTTAAPATDACTATALAIVNPGCNLCPTCHVAADGEAVASAIFSFSA